MKPAEYFPVHYQADLLIFGDGRIPLHGPFLSLCGMTLSRLLEPDSIKKYIDPAAFLCVLYGLNLLNQGIHMYCREDHRRWLEVSAPFPNSRGCLYHGNVTSSPSSVLKFAREPNGIRGGQPIDVPVERLNQFTEFFFRDYLPGLCQGESFLTLTSEKLAARLSADPGCPEFRQYIGVAGGRSSAET